MELRIGCLGGNKRKDGKKVVIGAERQGVIHFMQENHKDVIQMFESESLEGGSIFQNIPRAKIFCEMIRRREARVC